MDHAQRADRLACGVLWRLTTVPNILVLMLLAASALADEPQVHRDLAYAEPKNERQTLDVSAGLLPKNWST